MEIEKGFLGNLFFFYLIYVWDVWLVVQTLILNMLKTLWEKFGAVLMITRALCVAGSALKCNHCVPRGGTRCTQTQETCGFGKDACIAARFNFPPCELTFLSASHHRQISMIYIILICSKILLTSKSHI